MIFREVSIGTLHGNIISGACPWCNIEAVRVGRTAAYPGALALVPPESPALHLWENYMPEVDDGQDPGSDVEEEAPTNGFDAAVNAVINKGIQLRTSAEAVESGIRALALTSKAAKRLEPFKGVSVYVQMFPGREKRNIHTHTNVTKSASN